MKSIAALAMMFAAVAGCDFDNDLTIDNQGTGSVLVKVGYWVAATDSSSPDRWVTGTYRVYAGQQKTFTFSSKVDVAITRESDQAPLYDDTNVWDETIVVYP